MASLAWPNSRVTSCSGTFFPRANVANVWRRPWKVTYRTPARSQSRRKRCVMESGLGGRPSGRTMTNPVSVHPDPRTARSSAWIAFRLARQIAASEDSGMVRLLAAD